MEADALEQRISNLGDDEVEAVINRLVAANAAQHGYERKQLFADQAGLASAITLAAADVSVDVGNVREVDGSARIRLFRGLLSEMAARQEYQAPLTSALDARATLLEPVTSALVLSGIILVLSLDVDFKYEIKGGKKHVSIAVKKRPTAAKLLEKIAKLF